MVMKQGFNFPVCVVVVFFNYKPTVGSGFVPGNTYDVCVIYVALATNLFIICSYQHLSLIKASPKS